MPLSNKADCRRVDFSCFQALLHYFDKATGRKSRKPPQFAKKGNYPSILSSSVLTNSLPFVFRPKGCCPHRNRTNRLCGEIHGIPPTGTLHSSRRGYVLRLYKSPSHINWHHLSGRTIAIGKVSLQNDLSRQQLIGGCSQITKLVERSMDELADGVAAVSIGGTAPAN